MFRFVPLVLGYVQLVVEIELVADLAVHIIIVHQVHRITVGCSFSLFASPPAKDPGLPGPNLEHIPLAERSR